MKTKHRTNAFFICKSAIIAAMYVVLTWISASFGLSGGIVQFRISEALCGLAVFTPAAIPGMTVGCVVSGLVTGAEIWDVVFGSLATLAGITGTRLLRKNVWVAPAAYFAANTVAVPFILQYVYGSEGTLLFFFLTVGAGEAVCAYGGGVLLAKLAEKSQISGLLTEK